jgi:hypothetical protein
MANHPVLSLDPDLRLFLESESFEFEVSLAYRVVVLVLMTCIGETQETRIGAESGK